MIIKKDDIELNYHNILKHLGYHMNNTIDALTRTDLEESIKLLLKKSQPKYIYRTFDQFNINDDIIKLNKSLSIESKDLSRHLKDAKYIIALAVTLGIQTDQMIKKQMLMNPSKGLILDAVASELIEMCSDVACDIIIKNNSEFRNTRFSPGYGDLSLDVQEKIISTLDTRKKIGLFINDSFLLIPSKSITAFFGIFDTSKPFKKSCKNCQLINDCRYREKGVFCYDQTMG